MKGDLLRTKSRAKRFQVLAFGAVWLISVLACSQTYLSQAEIAATAGSLPTLPVIPPTQAATQTQTSTVEISSAVSSTPTVHVTPTLDPLATPKPPILYYTQAGDTLASITGRFGVTADRITSEEPLPEKGLIRPNVLLIIPDYLGETTSATMVMPDSEVVYSPSEAGFDIQAFIEGTNGYLKTYTEQMGSGNKTAAQIVEQVALENSVSPYLLLAILEYKSHWVYGQPTNLAEAQYPMGKVSYDYRGLYSQLSWTVQQLSIGYYGWRAGSLYEMMFADGTWIRMDPRINAGTAAVQYLFAQWYDKVEWAGALYGDQSMPKLLGTMFGDYLARSQSVEPLYPPDLTQPSLILPFMPNRVWSLTGGPHSAWGPDGALAALDFAPPSTTSGCVDSQEWVVAMAPGVIVRAENGQVMQDLDGDGIEQTGWDILYMHIATRDRVAVGTYLQTGDKIGHPSCEGGSATGTHTHVVRKYNGEWILAGGPMPFDMSGYVAVNGDEPYEGELVNGSKVVTADTISSPRSFISRTN